MGAGSIYSPRRLFRALRAGSVVCLALQAGCFEPETNSLPEWSLATAAPSGIRGLVSGLVASPITLQNTDGAELTLGANGAFLFPEIPEAGSAYNVTIRTQPTDLRCFVENGVGVYSGGATNIVVTCPLAVVAGLTWMRCTHGQSWNSLTGDCTGAGNAANSYGAIGDLVFCRRIDGLPDGGQIDGGQTNDCNSGFSGGALTAGANAHISTLFLACDSLKASATYGFNNWRPASKSELATIEFCSTGTTALDVNGGYACNPGSVAPTVLGGYFPNTVPAVYSSSTADGCCSDAYWVNYYTDGGVTRSSGTKQFPSYTRCVSP